MKVLVTGGNSQFAKSMRVRQKYQNLVVDYVSKSDLDITDYENWQLTLDEYAPEVVINAAAYTNVEAAEEHEIEAFAVNKDGAAFGALACKKANIKFVHLSTDYVFDGKGKQPLSETDPTDALNVYGASKREGERVVLEANAAALVIRISWLYSPFGKNFYTTMRDLFSSKDQVSVVNDQIASPTNAIHLAENLCSILPDLKVNESLHGIMHYAEEGEASWFDFASEIHRLSEAKCELVPVDSDFFKTKAERPKYSKLNNEKFKNIGQIKPLPWEKALEECFRMTDK